MKKKFLIRADASAEMGVGHLMRTIALGQILQDAGAEIHFATISSNGELDHLLGKENFIVHKICNFFSSDGGEDVRELLAIAGIINPNWIVIDGYHFTGRYEKIIKEAAPHVKILRIEDFPRDYHYADVLLCQNFGAENMKFRCHPKTMQLLGLDFLLLRREFRQAKTLSPVDNSQLKHNRLLVTLGGGATGEASLKIAKAIYEGGQPELNVIFNLGKLIKNAQEFDKYSKQGLIFKDFSSNIALEMDRSEIALVAGGSTMWELIYLGIPFLAVALNRRQNDYLEMLSNQGLCVNLGYYEDLSDSYLNSSIRNLIVNSKLKMKYKKRYSNLINPKNIGQKILEVLMI